jgi:hypothetical protein
VSLPKEPRDLVRARLWELAERLHWESMTNVQKTLLYDQWTEDPQIGGILSRFIDKSQVRVYIKDTLLKGFSRARLSSSGKPLKALGIEAPYEATEQYIKPHGLALTDGRVVCWGRAEDWRQIILSVFERSYDNVGLKPYGVVLFRATRKRAQKHREMVAEAASRLGVPHITWVDE